MFSVTPNTISWTSLDHLSGVVLTAIKVHYSKRRERTRSHWGPSVISHILTLNLFRVQRLEFDCGVVIQKKRGKIELPLLGRVLNWMLGCAESEVFLSQRQCGTGMAVFRCFSLLRDQLPTLAIIFCDRDWARFSLRRKQLQTIRIMHLPPAESKIIKFTSSGVLNSGPFAPIICIQ